jgi:Helicase conserved C-terminal domain
MADQSTDPAQRGPASSLAEWLRRRTDEQLIDLLRRRPDVALPAPADMPTLASRVGVRSSVQRAVDSLDAFRLRVLEARVLIHERVAPKAAILELLPTATPSHVTQALDDLRALVLVWGEDDVLRLVANVPDAVGPYPAGLGRPAARLLSAMSDVALAPVLRRLGLPPATQPRSGESVARVLGAPSQVAAMLDELDPAERDVLQRLAAGPPIGSVGDAVLPVDPAGEPTPPRRLIARGLLVPIDMQTVELPREVGLAVRGAEPLGAVPPDPPPIPTVDRTPDELDRVGATAVLDTLRLVEALGVEWTRRPAPALRGGGVGVRELRRTARALDVSEDVTAVVLETAAAAGLVAARGGMEPAFLPTTDYDGWLHRDAADRWFVLAAAWLTMTRQPSLVGLRDERDRLITALGPDAERGTIPAVRRTALSAVSDIPPGAAPIDRSVVLQRLAWLAPRRAAGQRPMVEAVLAEADQLGITAAGGLTGYGRALLAGGRPAAAEAVRRALPAAVDDFLVQPDLTVVVPGPPTTELARELGVAAELESTGGANVYRVTEASVRRALDSGRSGADLTALFGQRSRTPVPQALSYLIDDVARRHGLLRSGAASSYLRCDDESLLTRVIADRAVSSLEFRRIAPTVAVSPAAVQRVLEVLRGANYAPAGEAPDGQVLSIDEHPQRATGRSSARVSRLRPTTNTTDQLAEVVNRLRAGDQISELSRRIQTTASRVPGVTTAATLALLRDAIRRSQTVWLGYVDGHGSASQHTIAPISLGGGMVRGIDTSSGRLESFALHHITGVGVLEPNVAGSRAAEREDS